MPSIVYLYFSGDVNLQNSPHVYYTKDQSIDKSSIFDTLINDLSSLSSHLQLLILPNNYDLF